MAKKQATKAAASVGSWRTLLRAAPGKKKLGDLPVEERAALLASFVENIHQLTIHPDFADTPLDQ